MYHKIKLHFATFMKYLQMASSTSQAILSSVFEVSKPRVSCRTDLAPGELETSPQTPGLVLSPSQRLLLHHSFKFPESCVFPFDVTV